MCLFFPFLFTFKFGFFLKFNYWAVKAMEFLSVKVVVECTDNLACFSE